MTVSHPTTQRDLGWNLVELLLVVLILGVLAAGVGFALRSMRAGSADPDCGIDQHYDLQHHNPDAADAVTSEGSSSC